MAGDSDNELSNWWSAPTMQEGVYTAPPTAVAPAVQQDRTIKIPSVAPPTAQRFTPAELGMDPGIQQQFAAAGIGQLPEWMRAYGGSGRDLSDLVSSYQTIFDPNTDWNAFTSTGKAQDINKQLGLEAQLDPNSPLHDPAVFKDRFAQMYLSRKTAPNEGAFATHVLPAAQGIGSIAAMVGGLGALGAFSAPVAGATAGLGVPTAGAELTALGGGLEAFGPGGAGLAGLSGMGTVSDAIAAGLAGGADVGMGAGTSWLTDLGLPASFGNGLGGLLSYGSDALSGLDFSKLLGSGLNVGNLIGGGLVGQPQITAPTNIMTGSTSAPQTSQITQGALPGGGTNITPATMPTSSVMSAFGNRSNDSKPDYMKYFSTLF